MKKLALLDITTSDYFSGYHLHVFSIPMYDGVTFGDVANQIELELELEYNQIINEDGMTKEDEKLIRQFIKEYEDKGNEVFYKDENECIVEEEITYNDECPYAYFSIVDMKTINGITFLS
jgi:hypothetical protein